MAGTDEVGRGCLAGPVTAAAVILDKTQDWTGVRDSKTLSPAARDALCAKILGLALAVRVESVDASIVDRVNVLEASRMAMTKAVQGLVLRPGRVLSDAVRLTGWDGPQEAIVTGDTLSVSIAAASIVAKVVRDRWMRRLDALYPGYGFAVHKGYPTAAHRAALAQLGPSPIHRMTFRGVGA